MRQENMRTNGDQKTYLVILNFPRLLTYMLWKIGLKWIRATQDSERKSALLGSKKGALIY